MGVARNQDILVFLASLLECTEQRIHPPYGFFYPGTDEEFQIHKDLVVAGTAGVDFLADVSEFSGEHQFDLGMDILDSVLYHEIAGHSLTVK